MCLSIVFVNNDMLWSCHVGIMNNTITLFLLLLTMYMFLEGATPRFGIQLARRGSVEGDKQTHRVGGATGENRVRKGAKRSAEEVVGNIMKL